LGQLNAILASLKDLPDEAFLQIPTEGEREKKDAEEAGEINGGME
jgi:hypothetical protein